MADRRVVDTDVISFYLKGDSRASLYERHLRGVESVVSFMTIAELHRWALERRWGTRRLAELDGFLGELTIHLADRGLCVAWARVTHQARRSGRPIDAADAWIAATAWLLGVPLVTHNRRHYAGVLDLVVISEAAT